MSEQIKSTPQQRKYLLNRLDAARYNSRRSTREVVDKEPARIKQARKLIASWDKTRRALSNARHRSDERVFESAKAVVLFKTPEEALAAVEKYESRS